MWLCFRQSDLGIKISNKNCLPRDNCTVEKCPTQERSRIFFFHNLLTSRHLNKFPSNCGVGEKKKKKESKCKTIEMIAILQHFARASFGSPCF